MKDCILIGNSSSVLEKNLEQQINSFKNVVRFNRFKIKGFEKKLGKKCTHWVTGYNLATANMPVNRNYFKDNLDRLKSEHPELKQIIVLTSTLTKKKDKDILKLAELKDSIDIELIYKEYKPFFKIKPTSGFLAIKYFLNKFSKISIAGFDFGKSYHYWGNESIADVPAPNNKHSWVKEKEYVINNPDITML